MGHVRLAVREAVEKMETGFALATVFAAVPAASARNAGNVSLTELDQQTNTVLCIRMLERR